MLQFQFKKPITEVLSRVLLRTFKGIEKVWIIAEDSDNENFVLYQANQNDEKVQFVEEVELKKDNYLNNKHFYRWISLNDTPISADKDVRIQYNIFDEYKNSILHLFLPPDDGEFLVFYIFFSQQQAVDGPTADSRLSTDNKQFVAHTIYNLLQELHSNYMHDRMVANSLNKMQKRMSNANSGNHLQHFIQSFVNDYLHKTSVQHGVRFEITDEALSYLSTIALTPARLTELLNDAIVWLLNFSFSKQSKFVIERLHLTDSPAHEDVKKIDSDELHEEKYNRTFELLEKLEHAALKVINTGQKLTGYNVGQAFDTSISAPAITDALKKHAGKVRTLARIYPDRWPLIRNQFKPVQNVLEDETDGKASISA